MESQFSAKEKEILKFWQDKKIFEKSLQKKAPKGDYVFYDGPPFATGTPHYGHIVASLMKDAVPRFQTMNGYHVARRWGWDCHGLPVENLVEKEKGLTSKKQIEEEVGVCGFNEACRSSVMKYADVWKKFIPRIGRWVDMENDYKTMDPTFMESIWWVFKTLYDQGLISEGYKAMHICPRCHTTLSNFEVSQNYKDIKDLAVTVKFRVKKSRNPAYAEASAGRQKIKKSIELSENTFVLAWTTTPWTLPGNVALALGEKIKYVIIKLADDPANYILAKDRLSIINGKYEILNEVAAKDLAGLYYEPLFDYFVNADLVNKENLYTIQTADFVTIEDGTGVVHIAPGFGDDDLKLGQAKHLPTIIHVKEDGTFTDTVKDWPGKSVKLASDSQAMDRQIVDYLKAKGLVFASQDFSHSYPFCWRCDSPLLNYATSSWFVKVTEIKNKLIKNNQKINWVPEHLKAGRFGKWLENAADWAISRQRYWGTPIPIWRCQIGNPKSQIPNPKNNGNGCGQIKAIGSIKELEKLSGKKVTDLHKHIVDEITFKCEKCGGTMKRIPDVLDCWFESGAMPYAQAHYPFENKKWFENNFPAEFIAEGIDQTRGWFYTLMVLSTALFNKPAFKNVIANGIVLAEDGTKMAKRLKNYPDPDLIIDQYGADALRYYLLTSPVMTGENLNFSEKGVKEALQKVVMLLGNVLSFYLLYQNKNPKSQIPTAGRRGPAFFINYCGGTNPKNILDKWILIKLNLLIKEVTENMQNYDLVKSARPIGDFINELSTWYLRRSRERFKANDQTGIKTLGFVLLELAKIIAPFMPFSAENVYQAIGGPLESVHLENWPKAAKINASQTALIKEMELARQIAEQGLAARAVAGIKIRQPLASYTTTLAKKMAENILVLVKDELNVKAIKFGSTEKLDTEISEELKQEGLAREIIRQINQLRKDANLTINDKVVVYQVGLDEIFKTFGQEIAQATLAERVENKEIENMKEISGGKVGIKSN